MSGSATVTGTVIVASSFPVALPEIVGVSALDLAFRGFRTRVSTFGGRPIVESRCESCGECVVRCPVGALAPKAALPLGSLLAAAIGGLLMGYGARLSFGCNIGALFSGIASGSLHGWLWILPGLFGNWVGLTLRPLFGLDRQGGTDRGGASLATKRS